MAPRSPRADERRVLPSELAVERAGDAHAVAERRLLEQLEAELAPRSRAASKALLRALAKRALGRADLTALGIGRERDADDPRERAALAGVVDATLGELARAGTTADTLEKTRSKRGRALAALLRDVEGELALLDRFDARRALSAAARGRISESGRLPQAIELGGFAELSALRISLWLELHAAMRARGGDGVRLAWPRLDEGAGPISRLAESVEQRLADESDPFEIAWYDPESPQAVRTIEASGNESEARGVVRSVLDALDAGARPDRIHIVVPSPDENFMGPLRAHFEEAKLTLSEAYGPPVEHAPEAKLFASLLAMAATRLDRDAIVELLRTPGLHPGSLVEKAEELSAIGRAAELATRLREVPVAQHRTGSLFVDALIETLARDADKGAANRWMVPALERLTAALIALRDAGSLEVAIGALLTLSERLRLGEPSASEVNAALRAEAARHASSSMRAVGAGAVSVRAMTDALTGMRDAARLLGLEGQPVDLGELSIDLFELASATRTAARGGAGRAGAIRAGSLAEALGARHDLLIVTGLTATGYFRKKPASLLDEATRRALPPRERPASDAERILVREAEIAWALSSAERIVLTHSSTDDDGRLAEPAHARVYAAERAGAARSVEPASRLAPLSSRVSPRAVELAGLAAGASPPADLSARVAIERERYRFFVTPAMNASRFTGAIESGELPLLLERFGGHRPERALAVGAIERAALCGFRGFAERVLGNRRSEDAGDALSALERGDLLHKALYAAFECNRGLPPSTPLEERLVHARAAAEKDCATSAAGSAIRRDGRSRAVNDAIEVLRQDLEGDSPFAYSVGERPFNRFQPDPWGPLVLRGPQGREVFVEGRLDRLDVSRDGSSVRVVDYKSGAGKSRKLGDTDFQVPLYALVAKRLGAARTLGVYASIGQGGQLSLRPKKETEQELDLDPIAELAAAAVERVWAGSVAPRPRNPRVCDHCNARGLCRRPAVVPIDDDPFGDAL